MKISENLNIRKGKYGFSCALCDKQNNKYYYLDVAFKKGMEPDANEGDKLTINIKNAFLTAGYYSKRDEVRPKLMILDYDGAQTRDVTPPPARPAPVADDIEGDLPF